MRQDPSSHVQSITAATEQKAIHVTVYNDFACAWCHLGQQRLVKAIQMYRHGHQDEKCIVNVEWKPFQVDATVNVNGEPVDEYCQRRFGGTEWLKRLRRTGEADGVAYNNWKWFPNTLKAHQLMIFASRRGTSEDISLLVAALFDAVHEQGENISLVDTLVRIAIRCYPRCNAQELQTFLENDEGAEVVKREIKEGRDKFQVAAVPFYILTRVDDDAWNQSEPVELAGVPDADLLCDVLGDL
jgi:predicted DsbA family dithiol-disulfide isomerase